ncbi:MAG: VanZ family protein [Oscillospiraceae bacterium]
MYFLLVLYYITFKFNDLYFNEMTGCYETHVLAETLYHRSNGLWNININLVPFKAYNDWADNGLYDIMIWNILGNTAAFIPMGFFEMALSKHKTFWKVILKCFLIVLGLEFVQFITGFGCLDIDDITMNTFGCLLGCLGFNLLARFIRPRAKNFFTD